LRPAFDWLLETTVLEHDMTFVTRNVKNFHDSQVTIFNSLGRLITKANFRVLPEKGRNFMQTNIEQVTNIIRAMPLEDLDKLSEVIDAEKQAKREKKEKSNWRLERYKKARKWLDEHAAEYMNQWVCLEGDKLIAVDDDGRTVYQTAIEAGIESPFIHHIVEESKFHAGGDYELTRD